MEINSKRKNTTSRGSSQFKKGECCRVTGTHHKMDWSENYLEHYSLKSVSSNNKTTKVVTLVNELYFSPEQIISYLICVLTLTTHNNFIVSSNSYYSRIVICLQTVTWFQVSTNNNP